MSILDIKFPAFTLDAACRGIDPGLFFPPENSRGYDAKAICRRCDVVDQCLTYALEYEAAHPGSRWGIYGGTTPRQRRTMTERKRKRP